MTDQWKEFSSFLNFLANFIWRRIEVLITTFNTFKDVLVSLLMEKRGRYVRSFTHTTLISVILISIILVPFAASSIPSRAAPNTSQPVNMVLDINGTTPKEEINPYTTVSDKPRSTIIVYQVQPGDTLSTIADKFGISVNTIKWENKLKSNAIHIGQKLRILPVTGIAHRVTKGETIYSIAKKYHTSPQAIIDFPFNYFKDEDKFTLEVGQLLIVPDGVPPKAKKIILEKIDRFKNYTHIPKGIFLWPTTGVITQRYHWYHQAIDIGNPAGPPVRAVASGKVVLAGWTRTHGGYGLHVKIDHFNGYQTLYAHLRKLYVKPGQTVQKGQIIGLMGSTGRSTGTHLHFEIRYKGRKLNPLNFYK